MLEGNGRQSAYKHCLTGCGGLELVLLSHNLAEDEGSNVLIICDMWRLFAKEGVVAGSVLWEVRRSSTLFARLWQARQGGISVNAR